MHLGRSQGKRQADTHSGVVFLFVFFFFCLVFGFFKMVSQTKGVLVVRMREMVDKIVKDSLVFLLL